MNEFKKNTNQELIGSITTALGSDYQLFENAFEEGVYEPQFIHTPSETCFKIKIENRMQMYLLNYIECIQTTIDDEKLIRQRIKEVMYHLNSK